MSLRRYSGFNVDMQIRNIFASSLVVDFDAYTAVSGNGFLVASGTTILLC